MDLEATKFGWIERRRKDWTWSESAEGFMTYILHHNLSNGESRLIWTNPKWRD